VTLNVVGLADEKKTCIIVSGDINVADGILRCDLPNAEAFSQEGYHVRETVELDTMNRLVHGDYFMMKIDIEGSEPLALGSSGSDKYFAKHHIEYLLTESTDSAARLEYFQRLATLGYSLRMIDYGLQRGADDAMAMLGGGTLPDPFDKSKQARAEIQQVNAPDFFGERVDPVSAAQQEHGVDKSAPTAASIEFLGLTLEGRCADRIAALKKLHDVNKLQWATPHGAKGTTFDLLVHSVNDIVSSNLINSGGWEGVSTITPS